MKIFPKHFQLLQINKNKLYMIRPLVRSDSMILHYGTERLESVRKVFDIAKAKYTRRIGLIKEPIAKSETTYTIISPPTTKNLQQNQIIQELVKGMVLSVEKAKKPIKSGDWTDFRDQMFNHTEIALTSLLNSNGGNGTTNETSENVSDMDQYLLAFIVIESQISHLYSQAMLLLTNVNQMLDHGLLDIHQQSLNSKILPKLSAEMMVDQINNHYHGTRKVSTQKKDLLNDSIGIFRWASENKLKISYIFKMITSTAKMDPANTESMLGKKQALNICTRLNIILIEHFPPFRINYKTVGTW